VEEKVLANLFLLPNSWSSSARDAFFLCALARGNQCG
jgi:hypothetical protein